MAGAIAALAVSGCGWGGGHDGASAPPSPGEPTPDGAALTFFRSAYYSGDTARVDAVSTAAMRANAPFHQALTNPRRLSPDQNTLQSKVGPGADRVCVVVFDPRTNIGGALTVARTDDRWLVDAFNAGGSDCIKGQGTYDP